MVQASQLILNLLGLYKEPGNNGTTIASGQLTTNASGALCVAALTLNASHIGGPYQTNVAGTDSPKNDNFKVVSGSVSSNGTLTIIKSIVNNSTVSPTAFGYSITSPLLTSPVTGTFEADGSNAVPLNLNDGPFTVTETQANGTGYTTTYSGCSAIALTAAGATCTITNTYTVTPPPVPGCTDPTAFNYNPNATSDDGSCTPKVFGCTDPTAFNYNSLANVSDNSCIPKVVGCMNPAATNYDSTANVDSGNCQFPTVPGCTDPTAFNYNSLANVSDNSCIPKVLGCTDDTALNFNVNANVDDGSCKFEVLGCVDPTALNYNKDATLGNPDAEKCTYDNGGGPDPVLGCTNPAAQNYNPNATRGNADAANCTFFATQCIGGVEAPNLLTNGSFEDPTPTANGGQWEIFSSITGWVTTNGIEIWNNLLNGPSLGLQNAELDTTAPTKITQTVATIPGATYELRFDFAARSDASDATNNSVVATADTATVKSISTSNTAWVTYGNTFVASDTSTDIAFEDVGTADSFGTLLDNAVLCLVRQPVVVDDGLTCDITANATSIRRGEDITLNWSSTNAADAKLDGVSTTTSGSLFVENLRSATTYTLTVYGKGEGEDRPSKTCSVTIDTRGGGGGGSRNNDRPNGEVLGEATSTPEVLGQQVEAVPTGAPNAGAGSTSPFTLNYLTVTPVAFFRRTKVHG